MPEPSPQPLLATRTPADAMAAPPNGVPPQQPDGSSRWKGLLGTTALWVAAVDVLLIALFTILSHNQVFFSVNNFQNLALSASEVVLLALGEAFLLGAAEFDISLGANLVLSSVVSARVMVAVSGGLSATGTYSHVGLAIFLGVLAALATGMVVGIVNGLVVTYLRVNSLLATLAMFGAASGVADLLASGGDIAGVPSQLQTGFGISQPAGIPLPAIAVAAIVLAGWLLLATTRFGLHTLALGSSREAARRAGLKVNRHVIALFAGAGLLAGVAGLIDLSRFATTDISGHQTDALAAIAGAVIGGTALFGGRVSVIGAVVGTLFSVIVQVGLVILGVTVYYQLIATGAILVIAVSLDERRRAAGTQAPSRA